MLFSCHSLHLWGVCCFLFPTHLFGTVLEHILTLKPSRIRWHRDTYSEAWPEFVCWNNKQAPTMASRWPGFPWEVRMWSHLHWLGRCMRKGPPWPVLWAGIRKPLQDLLKVCFPKSVLLKRWDADVPVSHEAPSQAAPGRDTEPNSRAAGLLQQAQVLHSVGDKQTWAEKLQGQVQEQCWYHQAPRGTGEPIRAWGHIPWGGKKHACLGRAFATVIWPCLVQVTAVHPLR